MVVKKKNLGIKMVVLLVLLLLNLFAFCTSSYASETLHPINQMTPEIATKIFDYFKENNSFSYANNVTQTDYDNFYSQITNEKLENFCTSWNSKDYSNCADYIEQCLFIIYGYDSTLYLKVYFNNNTIGNTFSHLQMEINSGNYTFFYRDDLDKNVSGFGDHWILNQSGTITYSWRQTVNTTGNSINFNTVYSNITTFNSSNDYFSSKIMCTVEMPQSIYLRKYNESSYKWFFLGESSLIDLPNSDTGGGDTGGGDTGGGDTGGGTTTPNYKEELNNINNSINNQGQAIIENQNQNTDKISEKLDGISGEIGNINENLTTVPDISGITINSGDITGALNFEFAEDPYANFWLELTTRTFWCFN